MNQKKDIIYAENRFNDVVNKINKCHDESIKFEFKSDEEVDRLTEVHRNEWVIYCTMKTLYSAYIGTFEEHGFHLGYVAKNEDGVRVSFTWVLI